MEGDEVQDQLLFLGMGRLKVGWVCLLEGWGTRWQGRPTELEHTVHHEVWEGMAAVNSMATSVLQFYLGLTSQNSNYGNVRNWGKFIKPHPHALVTISSDEASPSQGPATFQSSIIDQKANGKRTVLLGATTSGVFIRVKKWFQFSACSEMRNTHNPLQHSLLMAILPQALYITFQQCVKMCWWSSFPDMDSSPFLVTYGNRERIGLSLENSVHVFP